MLMSRRTELRRGHGTRFHYFVEGSSECSSTCAAVIEAFSKAVSLTGRCSRPFSYWPVLRLSFCCRGLDRISFHPSIAADSCFTYAPLPAPGSRKRRHFAMVWTMLYG